MTLLEVVNGVLRRLREPVVTNTSDTVYSTMLVDFVNDAKTLVENAHDWIALRATINFSTVASTTNYALAGSGSRMKIINVLNDTGNRVLIQKSQSQVDRMQTLTTTPESDPYSFTFRGTDANGDLTVDLYPTPDAIYSIDFNVVKPQVILVASTNDATEILVPANPIIHLVMALAARERGETGGTSTAELFTIADAFLADDIALDMARSPAESIWYYV
tara:strand:+ start:230 stop:886 length:657 start_codon:yes stop_codon:yes gene_type:complete